MHPDLLDQSPSWRLARYGEQVTASTHGTGGLNALRGSTPLPSLRKARASLRALTFNCGIRDKKTTGRRNVSESEKRTTRTRAPRPPRSAKESDQSSS